VATTDSKHPRAPEKSSATAKPAAAPGQENPAARNKTKVLLGCFRRREAWVPTWRGVLLLITVLLIAMIAGVLTVHPFLAPNHPIPDGILVIEGWGPDYALQAAAEEFNRGHYDRLYVTGGPLEHGGPLSEYKSFAELGAATLLKLGLTTNIVQAVPAPLVQQDRTYNSSLALRQYLDEHSIPHPALNLISMGPHARRSLII
jgi:hypothetical protein